MSVGLYREMREHRLLPFLISINQDEGETESQRHRQKTAIM